MRRAAAVVLGDQLAVQCIIWDMSGSGARLAVPRPGDLPHTFSLLLTKDGSVRRNCEIVWMDTRFVGVKFV